MLSDGAEIAPIDVREELTFSLRHLLWTRNVPLSRLELRFAQLVPHHAARIVLVDDSDGLAQRAAEVLARAGYTDLSILNGGVTGWEKAGFELFSGVNVPSKAFGEHVEHDSGTPSISASELDALINSNADIVVVDSRPFDEYQRVSIPTSTNVPGAELVLRIHDIAPKPETLVVVNCAGRTRSIIGAQSLINAGLPNKVVALRNGTMGYNLAGFATESGKNRRALTASAQALERAKQAADRVASRYQNQAHQPCHHRMLASERAGSHPLPVRRPQSGGIRRRPCAGRDFRARRPARSGDRPIRRHTRRAHRADRRT